MHVLGILIQNLFCACLYVYSCWFEVTPSADNDVLWAFVAPKLIVVTVS